MSSDSSKGHVALLTGIGGLLGCEAGAGGFATSRSTWGKIAWLRQVAARANHRFQVAAEIGREYRGKGSNLILGPSVQAHMSFQRAFVRNSV